MDRNICIYSFPASYGESFLVKLYGEETVNILIDCGFSFTAEAINKELKKIKENNEEINLLILTHIDNDHISGARNVLKFILDKEISIKEIWYNDYLKIIGDKALEGDIPNEIKRLINKINYTNFEESCIERKKEQVGYREAICLTEYFYSKGIYDKWNKSFNHESVCLNDDGIITININKEVKISLLGPSRSNLDELYKEWENYLTGYLNNETKFKRKDVAKAFEKYFLYLYKKYREVTKESCSNNIIEDMIEYSKFDDGVVNRTSISCVIEFNGNKLLFLGDSSPIDLEKKLELYIEENSNKFELIKVAHHGSKNNTSRQMVEMCKCEKFLISTNGMKYNHPDVESLAKILFVNESNKDIYLNYKPKKAINYFKMIGKDISEMIICKNDDDTSKEILEVCL